MMNEIRQRAADFRRRIEANEMLASMEEAAALCVTLDEALTAFDGEAVEGEDGSIEVSCCGRPAEISSGLICGQMVSCRVCGAKAVEATSPMFSPFLPRGNAWVTFPSEEFCGLLGDRNWIVLCEGNRP